jgi:muramoyltetrapeptide carboxypeptidase
MNAVLPKYLHQGDVVGIVSPSGIVESEPIEKAIAMLKTWGLKVKVGKHCFNRHGIFAGSDSQRVEDLNAMIHDAEIKAIFCSRGGYGAARIVSKIDFSYLKNHPKWIIGFSDVTVLHSALQIHQICSIHAVMPNSFSKTHSHSLESLRKMIFGESVEYSIPYNVLNSEGEASGILVGGNLSILYSLRGTPYDLDFSNKILFIEDIGEKLYHLDRMLMNLELGGCLSQLNGLIVGGFSEMTDGSIPYGKSAEGIIKSVVEKYSFPVIFDFKAGHINENVALMFGKEVTIRSLQSGCLLTFNI